MTELETVPFGTTDMAITRVGFGAWAIGGAGWYYSLGEQKDEQSIETIRHAVDAGINWIDTAAVYGLGHSEEVVGRALADIPADDRPYVFTKGGMHWDEDPWRQPRKVGDPASLRHGLDSSLRRLAIERVDLYQMHWPAEDGTPLEEYWGALLELRDTGKVRAVGLSNHDVEQLERAEALGHVDSLQPLFNAIRREAADDVLPWCALNDTATIVYSPMACGLLSGAYDRDRAESVGPGDWRSKDPEFHGEALMRNLHVVAAMRRVAERHAVGVPAIAVAWTLAFTEVTGAIVGARTPAHVDGWIVANDLVLTAEDLDEIADAIDESGAGDGPARPGT